MTTESDGGQALFVYGTLTNAALRRRLLGRDVYFESGRLKGFRRHKNRYFYIRPEAGAVVDGIVLFGLTLQELARLDQYEEVPHLYTRQQVQVECVNKGTQLAWVYLPTARLLKSQRRDQN